MLNKINKHFLNTWVDFPGPNQLKYIFVLIGLLAWIEIFFPSFKFADYYISIILNKAMSGNVVLGLISFIAICGVAVCGLLWLPSYLMSIFKVWKANK